MMSLTILLWIPSRLLWVCWVLVHCCTHWSVGCSQFCSVEHRGDYWYVYPTASSNKTRDVEFLVVYPRTCCLTEYVFSGVFRSGATYHVYLDLKALSSTTVGLRMQDAVEKTNRSLEGEREEGTPQYVMDDLLDFILDPRIVRAV